MFTGQKAKLIVLMLGIYLCASFVMRQPVSGQTVHFSGADSLPDVTDSLFSNLAASLASDSSAFKDILPAFAPNDTLQVLPMLPADSAALASDSVAKKKGTLDFPVTYEAKDSIVLTAGNFAYLFGEGHVKYEQIELEAEFIEMDMDNNTVFAKFGIDSLGAEFGYPLFKEGENEYDSKTMRYNFKSKKGYITDVITEQGDGYLTALETKKLENDDLFIRGGRYTTCDQHDHPHFYMQLTKAKVRPKKNVVSGPAYLVVEDVPLPIALPFGFFPFNSKYSSGVIVPSFGDEMTRGFYAQNGGYYFAINNHIDLALTGEIYTKGSWGVQARSRYVKRYKYSGNFDASYLVTVTGDKGLPDYSKTKDFKVIWSHAQDAKANPFRSLSASVNLSTTSYDRRSITSMYNDASTQNTKGSTVSYTQRFANTPFNFSASMSVNQSSRDGMLTVALPELNLNYPRFFPFQRKVSGGKQQWYEKISISYTGRLSNRYSGKGNRILKSNLLKDWNNYMTHSIPVSATYTVFKYLNVTPSFNYDERWQTNRVTQSYDYMNQGVQRDTTYGFYRSYSYRTSVSFETTLYGFFKPLPFLGKKVDMIRHVLKPNVSVSYSPDFKNPKYGFWDSYTIINPNGDITTNGYSRYPGVSPSGLQGNISFGIKNNIEAKIASDKDSTGFKRVSLIDNLGASWGYNMAADSFNWSNISGNILLKLPLNYTLSLSGQFDPYTYRVKDNGNGNYTPYRVSVPRWKAGKGFARLMGTSTNFSYTFDNDTWKKWFGKDKDKDEKNSSAAADDGNRDDILASDEDMMRPGGELSSHDEGEGRGSGGRLRDQKKEVGEFDDDGYLVNKVRWSLQLNYGLQYVTTPEFDFKALEYKRKLRHTFDFSGNISPTKSWNFSFQSSYDFEEKTISYLRCSASKNIHCFEIEASFIPIGANRSYNVTIRAVSSMLADLLKYKKQNTGRDVIDWY